MEEINALLGERWSIHGFNGGYRGWACKVTPQGEFIPYASGLRSPAGLGFGPDGRLWYAENQGEYVGSSKVVPLEEVNFMDIYQD